MSPFISSEEVVFVAFILSFLGHLSHSGDLLLWVGVRRHVSSIEIFFSRTTEPILTKFGM